MLNKQGARSNINSQSFKSASTLKGAQEANVDLQKENLDQNVKESKQQPMKSAIGKKPLGDRMAMKGLKLKTQQEQEHYPNILKGSNAESEMAQLKEEIKTLQAENRFYSENYKSFEKLANEFKIELREKDELVEQLTLENENYKRIFESQNSSPSQLQLQNIKEENEDLMRELESTKLHNRKLQELVYKLETAQSTKKEEATPVKENIKKQDQDNNSQKLIQDLQMKCTVLLDITEKKEHEIKEALNEVEELTKEREEMLEEITYYKDMAKMSKKHAEKAIADVEFYKGLLAKK